MQIGQYVDFILPPGFHTLNSCVLIMCAIEENKQAQSLLNFHEKAQILILVSYHFKTCGQLSSNWGEL